MYHLSCMAWSLLAWMTTCLLGWMTTGLLGWMPLAWMIIGRLLVAWMRTSLLAWLAIYWLLNYVLLASFNILNNELATVLLASLSTHCRLRTARLLCSLASKLLTGGGLTGMSVDLLATAYMSAGLLLAAEVLPTLHGNWGLNHRLVDGGVGRARLRGDVDEVRSVHGGLSDRVTRRRINPFGHSQRIRRTAA